MTDGGGDKGFQIIACPHPAYENPELLPLKADEAVREIADLLRPWGGRLDEWVPLDEPRTYGRTAARLADWKRASRDGNTTLIWIGHGRTDMATRQASLVVRGDPGTEVD